MKKFVFVILVSSIAFSCALKSGDVEDTATSTDMGNSASALEQDVVYKNITTSIRTWSDPEIPDFESSKPLKRIWVESGKRPRDFYPAGARSLVSEVRKNEFLKDCKFVQEKYLRLEYFDRDGMVQTPRDLWKRLQRCS